MINVVYSAGGIPEGTRIPLDDRHQSVPAERSDTERFEDRPSRILKFFQYILHIMRIPVTPLKSNWRRRLLEPGSR
jgi:hypothetical protein